MFDRDRYALMPEPKKAGQWLLWDTATEKVAGRLMGWSWRCIEWQGEGDEPTQDDLKWLAGEYSAATGRAKHGL